MKTRKWLFAGGLAIAAALAGVTVTATAQVTPPAPPVVPQPPEVPAPPVVPAAPVVPEPAAPVVPPATATEPAPAPAPAPAAEPAAPSGPSFEFGLRGEDKTIAPYTSGDAKTEEGKIDVTPDKNTLTITMTGGVGANVFLGCHSEALQSFRLIQEIDVSCSDQSVKEMILTLDSKLVGFVRSKQKASACVRLASLTVTPAGSTTPILSVSHPLPCVGGGGGIHTTPLASQSTDPAPAIRSQPLPLGIYLIDANFILTATAEGFLDAHSTAIFSPEPTELDPWEREHDPLAGEKKDGYGFTSVLSVSTTAAQPLASEKVWNTLKKRLAKEKREVQKQKELAKQLDPTLANQSNQPLLPQARNMPTYQPTDRIVR